MLMGLQRDRWIAVLLGIGLLVLLVLVLRDYGVGLPQFPRPTGPSETSLVAISENQLDDLLGTSGIPALRLTNLANPFFTVHFQPPQPTPPTTRKVNMTYQGFFQTTDGDRLAFVYLDDTHLTVPLGRPVVADLAVGEINTHTLVLTNGATRTNILTFNQTAAVEVPVP
jgi:hypothetical protein